MNEVWLRPKCMLSLCALVLLCNRLGAFTEAYYEAAKLRNDPAVRAALDMIASAEVGELGMGGYYRVYGRPASFVITLEKHPATVVCAYLGGKRVCATAAGRYQFLKRTWDIEVAELGLRDFGPLSQDLAAIHQLMKVGAIPDIRRQNLKGFFDKACIVWATLPGSPYGQPMPPAEKLKKTFKSRYAFYRRRALDV